jgi:pimeloyl-ACP methyl ester carboxylesterase
VRVRWKTVRKWWAISGTGAFLIFTLWNLWAYRARLPRDWSQSSDTVRVVVRDEAIYLLASPPHASAGVLFFPGGLVDPRAYVPVVRHVAERGISCAIVKLPRRGAFVQRGDGEVHARAHQAVKELSRPQSVVAGHSKGALFAAEFALANRGVTKGLVLIGSSHPRELNLAALSIPVTKIYATNDGLATPARVRATSANLPVHTRWVLIEGGNHSQFASYGFQPGDRFADIIRAKQQAIVESELLRSLGL